MTYYRRSGQYTFYAKKYNFVDGKKADQDPDPHGSILVLYSQGKQHWLLTIFRLIETHICSPGEVQEAEPEEPETFHPGRV